jgi:hypothetical protein
MIKYVVVRYKNNNFNGVLAGIGRKNKNSWDSNLCRSSAYRYAKKFNSENDGYTYKVETST